MSTFPDLTSYAYTPTKGSRTTPKKVSVKHELPEDVSALTLTISPEEPPAGSLRRSPRKHTSIYVKEESEDDASGDELPSVAIPKRTGNKRKAVKADNRARASPKKIKRDYAPPEAYAHLEPLHDWLGQYLDVMFCGINPGCLSAQTGHHFAHPTNHFWRCLHQAGFTDRLLKPEEDMTLPAAYNIGLTNLVERPSAEAAELSKADMSNGVPTFLAKIALYRPRVVCFVGKQIGEIFLKEASARALPSSSSGLPQAAADASTPTAENAKTKKKVKVKAVPFQWGFQPYKVVHPDDSAVQETFFFITPSSSARVVGYQLADKVKLLKTLHDQVQELKAGEAMDPSGMGIIPLPVMETTAEQSKLLSA